MPSEPEKPIEKLLRRWSSHRRERAGESWRIHPVTRRLWQEEVARRFGNKGRPRQSWFWRLLGTRQLIAVGSTVALIAIAGWLLLPRHANSSGGNFMASKAAPAHAESRQMQLADNDKTLLREPLELKKTTREIASSDLQKAAALQPEATKENNFSRESLLDKNSAPALQPAQNSPAKSAQASSLVAASTPSEPAAGVVAQRLDMGRGVQTETAVPAGSQAGMAPLSLNERETPTARALAADGFAGGLARSTNVVQYGLFTASQSFAPTARDSAVLSRRTFRAAPKATIEQQSRAANGILVSFRVEQAGHELRIIDSDNSVYTGPIEQTNLLAGTTVQVEPSIKDDVQSFSPARAEEVSAKGAAPVRGSYFQVIGTNRSSNQRVVFEGTISGATNLYTLGAAFRDQAALDVGGRATATQPRQAAPFWRLNGTAQIGGNQEIRIDAVPAMK